MCVQAHNEGRDRAREGIYIYTNILGKSKEKSQMLQTNVHKNTLNKNIKNLAKMVAHFPSSKLLPTHHDLKGRTTELIHVKL